MHLLRHHHGSIHRGLLLLLVLVLRCLVLRLLLLLLRADISTVRPVIALRQRRQVVLR